MPRCGLAARRPRGSTTKSARNRINPNPPKASGTRSLPMIRTFSLLAALLLASPLFAQDLPYAFLSTDPKEPTAGAPQRSVPSLLLRANNELPYFVYVRNPGTDERDKLVVLLAADEK